MRRITVKITYFSSKIKYLYINRQNLNVSVHSICTNFVNPFDVSQISCKEKKSESISFSYRFCTTQFLHKTAENFLNNYILK